MKLPPKQCLVCMTVVGSVAALLLVRRSYRPPAPTNDEVTPERAAEGLLTEEQTLVAP